MKRKTIVELTFAPEEVLRALVDAYADQGIPAKGTRHGAGQPHTKYLLLAVSFLAIATTLVMGVYQDIPLRVFVAGGLIYAAGYLVGVTHKHEEAKRIEEHERLVAAREIDALEGQFTLPKPIPLCFGDAGEIDETDHHCRPCPAREACKFVVENRVS